MIPPCGRIAIHCKQAASSTEFLRVVSMNRQACLVFALLLMVPAAGVPGQTNKNAQTVTPVESGAGEVCAQFRATPGDYEKVFAPAFLTKVPPSQLTPVFARYFAQLGSCTKATLVKPDGPDSGDFEFIFEKGFSVPSKLSTDA